MTRVNEDEGSGGGADGNGLYNCQPFPPMPALPLPKSAAGCARAQPLDDIDRIFHGTGAGYTTVKVRGGLEGQGARGKRRVRHMSAERAGRSQR